MTRKPTSSVIVALCLVSLAFPAVRAAERNHEVVDLTVEADKHVRDLTKDISEHLALAVQQGQPIEAKELFSYARRLEKWETDNTHRSDRHEVLGTVLDIVTDQPVPDHYVRLLTPANNICFAVADPTYTDSKAECRVAEGKQALLCKYRSNRIEEYDSPHPDLEHDTFYLDPAVLYAGKGSGLYSYLDTLVQNCGKVKVSDPEGAGQTGEVPASNDAFAMVLQKRAMALEKDIVTAQKCLTAAILRAGKDAAAGEQRRQTRAQEKGDADSAAKSLQDLRQSGAGAH